MFDEKPGAIEDIFEGTDTGDAHGGVVTQGASTAVPPALESRGGFFSGKLVWAGLGGFVLLVLVGGGLYLALAGGWKSAAAVPLAPTASEPVTTPTPDVLPSPSVTPTPVPASAVVPPMDTDRDGLSDADEVSYGTSPTSPDTDSDGLSDADEVRVYKTNPLSPDTDKDGYTDGQEVKGGYDPNGPGKLQDINKALKK